MAQPNPSHLYRQTSIGTAFADSIDTLIQRGAVTEPVANTLMLHFDRAMAASLSNNLRSMVQIHGKVDNYRFCDDLWTFTINDPTVKIAQNGSMRDSEPVPVEGKLRLVAFNSPPPEDEDEDKSAKAKRKRKKK